MICWITPLLGTGPFGVDQLPDETHCVDIRALVDKGGNSSKAIHGYVQDALTALEWGKRVVICCDHGISRSNAIAAAVLSQYQQISFPESVRRVLSATGNAEIRLEVLEAVRSAMAASSIPPVKSERQRWLLTGGHGYLGAALADSAPLDIELLRPSHTELDLVRGGVALDLFVREQQVTKILHFAAPHVGNTNTSVGESIAMLRNVLDVCVSSKVPLFFPSRWEVFSGYKGQQVLASETTSLMPAGVLGDAKFLAEKLIEQYMCRDGVQATILRSGLVYGGRSAPNFLRNFIRRALTHETIITHVYRNGTPQLDLISLDDWINACWRLLDNNDTVGVYHCGAGELISTMELACIIVQSLGSISEIEEMYLDDSVANVALDSKRLKNDLGWIPATTVVDGIRKFVRRSFEESV